MNVERRSKLVEGLSTAGGALRLFFLSPYTAIFVTLGVIAAGAGHFRGWAEPFFIGETFVPKMTGAGATNMAITILALVGLLARAVFIGIRWYQLRWLIEEFRSRGVYDVNADGRTDTFADEFLDDL